MKLLLELFVMVGSNFIGFGILIFKIGQWTAEIKDRLDYLEKRLTKLEVKHDLG
jgi:hypothetical protein